jgi:DNA-binding LacI/PurR family transcriptional regulator
MAHAAAGILMDMVGGIDPPANTRLPFQLVRRGSTASYKQRG